MIKNNASARRAALVCTVFTSIVAIAFLYGRVVSGVCPIYEPLDSFDVESYTGIWYELQRDKEFMSGYGECGTAQYSLREQGGVNVQNSEYVEGSGKNSIAGYALPSAFFPGYLNVFFFAGYGGEYSIIDTDYTSYSIVYGCTQFGPFKSELTWVLVRD